MIFARNILARNLKKMSFALWLAISCDWVLGCSALGAVHITRLFLLFLGITVSYPCPLYGVQFKCRGCGNRCLNLTFTAKQPTNHCRNRSKFVTKCLRLADFKIMSQQDNVFYKKCWLHRIKHKKQPISTNFAVQQYFSSHNVSIPGYFKCWCFNI